MLEGMSLIETTTFRLVDDANETTFLEADRRVQSGFAYQQPGIIRRTMARGFGDRDGEWLVVTLWASEAHATASAAAGHDDPATIELRGFVDERTLDVRRYADLD